MFTSKLILHILMFFIDDIIRIKKMKPYLA